VWDLESGRALRTLEGHSDGVNGVAVTPGRPAGRFRVSGQDAEGMGPGGRSAPGQIPWRCDAEVLYFRRRAEDHRR
jgi:hypothetical protein